MERDEYRKILESAIENETEAHIFYAHVAGKFENSFLKEMFKGFAEEEMAHKRILETFLSGGPAGIHFKKSKDYRISETVEIPKLSINMKPADALAIAMKNEEDAMNMYLKFARAAMDTETKKIFNELAEMERNHKVSMEKAFVDIGYPEVW